MEWFDFSGWDSDVYQQPFSVRDWVHPDDKSAAPPVRREEVAAQLEAFVKACPDALLRQVAPHPEVR